MKTKPTSLRFDENDLLLAMNKSGIKKTQKLMDFLLSEYVREFKPKFVPLPEDYLEIKKLGVVSPNDGKKPLLGIKDLTKPTNEVKPQELPKTNFSVNTAPKTLDELKAMCPKELTGLDRSEWIRTERQKYGI